MNNLTTDAFAYDAFMPQAAWDRASGEERAKVAALLEKAGTPEGIYDLNIELEKYFSGSELYAYLALATPWRYSIVGQVSEELALELLAWDSARPNYMHTRFMRGSAEELAFDQRLSMTCGLLANPNLSGSSARTAVEEAEAAWPGEYGESTFPDLLAHVLWDRWTPHAFAWPVLDGLATYMNERDCPEQALEFLNAKEYDDE